MKTPARIEVYGFDPIEDLITLSATGQIRLMHRNLDANDLTGAQLVYAAQEDDAADHAVAQSAREHGVLVNIVDNLRHSDFITPAIVIARPSRSPSEPKAQPHIGPSNKGTSRRISAAVTWPFDTHCAKLPPQAAALPMGGRAGILVRLFPEKGTASL